MAPHRTASHPKDTTVLDCSMLFRKWREIKLQPSRARSSYQLSCCLLSLSFLCDILQSRTVDPVIRMDLLYAIPKKESRHVKYSKEADKEKQERERAGVKNGPQDEEEYE